MKKEERQMILNKKREAKRQMIIRRDGIGCLGNSYYYHEKIYTDCRRKLKEIE